MRHRLFVAINLPEDIKNKLASYQAKWPELPARWTKKNNIHITLVFLGYTSDEEIVEVCEIVRDIAQKNQSFSINLNRICYGPPGKVPPRMVWVKGEKSEELGKLQKNLQNVLFNSSFKEENESNEKNYTSHITLGRIKEWEFRRIEPDERPQIDEDISLDFDVNSIEVMESRLKKGGAEYVVLESAPMISE